jgi:phosphohistidine swiveling domain-containing protein
MVPWSGNRNSGSLLKGTGTSGGKVTAPACVLFGPEDFSKMKPGDVLVAVTTTPAWTPLFAMAAAVLTDIGGPLSHSSIVAREYGVPAVTLGLIPGLRNGQMVTVDGDAGTVMLRSGWGKPTTKFLYTNCNCSEWKAYHMTTPNRNIWILSFTLLVVMLGYGMVLPVMPFYITKLGAGGTELGWLMSTYSLMQLICAPLWGILSDRVGRKPAGGGGVITL